jgi:steroid 5-alpha reductase family enzyme
MTFRLLLEALVLQWFALAAVMLAAWVAWRRTKKSGWIDTGWTLGVGLVGVPSALIAIGAGESSSRRWLVAALVACWSLRLGWHLALRTWQGGDDPRYGALINEWGAQAPGQMLRFAQIQALAAIPLVVTILVAAHIPVPELSIGDWLGVGTLAVSIAGEALADDQLRRFSADRSLKGKVCNRGLWAWSRHPNYFFQWLGWLSYPVIALASVPVFPWALLTLSAAVWMYWLLVHVSGIPPLEQHMVKSRGEIFRAYQMSTNAFFPGPTRRAAR